MRTISVLVLGMVLCLGAWAADSTIHGLPNGTAPLSADVTIIDRESPPGTWHNYKLPLSSIATTQVITTNYYTFGTNYYYNDTYVSNYFETNILVDATSSNYFATYNYVTNTYQTNVTIEQYLTSNSYVSNYVTTNIFNDTYTSNYFSTNLFPTTYVYVTNTIGGDFIANLNGVGTNTTLYGTSEFKGAGNGIIELYDSTGTTLLGGFNGTYWWGNGSGLTNLNVVTTNLTLVQATTVLNETNIFNVAKGGTLVITNNIHPVDVSWSGPTNLISYTNALQNYTALVPCSITNTANVMAGVGNSCLLCVTNASSTNITVLVPAAFKVGIGESNPYTVTNADIIELWFYEASGRKTVTARGFH